MTDYNLIVSPACPVASKKTSMVITRKVEFSASHVCRDPRLSDQENQRIYGMAANPHGHGHNYVVEVSLVGDPDPLTGTTDSMFTGTDEPSEPCRSPAQWRVKL